MTAALGLGALGFAGCGGGRGASAASSPTSPTPTTLPLVLREYLSTPCNSNGELWQPESEKVSYNAPTLKCMPEGLGFLWGLGSPEDSLVLWMDKQTTAVQKAVWNKLSQQAQGNLSSDGYCPPWERGCR